MLGQLVRALLPRYPDLQVPARLSHISALPQGSTLVLVPRAEDADQLNLGRPIFAYRELRAILFCDSETTVVLAKQAPDFFDWISHRVECPSSVLPYVPVYVRAADLREACTRLESAGAKLPGRMAALANLQPELIDLLVQLLERGISETQLGAELMQATDPVTALREHAQRLGMLSDTSDTAGGKQLLPRLRRASLAEIERRLQSGEAVDASQVAALNELSLALHERGQNAGAEHILRQALSLTEQHPGVDRAASLLLLGRVLAAQGRYAEAERELQQVLSLRDKDQGASPSEAAQAVAMLAQIKAAAGRP
jgi:tetratricopeptide (TPR) repeat protein